MVVRQMCVDLKIIKSRTDLESNVRSGSASSPIAKLKYRFSAPVRWWQRSIVRIVAGELYRFPLRIRAILRTRNLRFGPEIPLGPKGHFVEHWLAGNTFLKPCSDYMQQLQRQDQWIGALDLQMVGQAYGAGAAWALDNACSGKDSESR
jgi:hypothetical protein